MVKIKFLGHSCFSIEGDQGRVLIDPFIKGNPSAKATYEDLKPDLILLTHGHGDHLGDAIEISQKTGAVILAVYELANYCQEKGAKVFHAHMGGKIVYPFGWVKLIPAFHSSSTHEGVYTGSAVGFIVNYQDVHIYHAGDTCVFGDMKLAGKLFGIDIALLPIGGNFVMDIEEAIEAVRLTDCKIAIPMHYDTFPVIEADPEEFRRLADIHTDCDVVVLKPGETFETVSALL